MIFILSLALLVDGHHPLPKRFSTSACTQSEMQLRSHLRTGLRSQRLRALSILKRCHLSLPLVRLQQDRDAEIRLSAWRIILSNASMHSPLWKRAYESLPIAQGRSILRLQRRTQRHLDALQRNP